MKNTMKKFSLILAGLLLCASGAFAQTILTMTTLSSSTDGSQQKIIVASATGINAPSANDPTKATFIYVDRELMDVEAVSGTSLTVIRGAESTAGRSHASSSLVFVIPAYLVTFSGGQYGASPAVPAGSCTRANELWLPRIQFISGLVSDCIGGQWVTGDALMTQRLTGNAFLSPYTGGTLYTSLDTNGTAPGANTEQYCTEIDLPYSKLLTGIALLNGTTVGTDKHLVILYDSSGNVLANSATAGATTSGASTFQKQAFLMQYYAVGPARYFGCWQTNGTTDTVRRIDTAADQGLLAGKITAQTFGTVAAITPPSTFTTALGAYLYVY